LDTVSRQIFGDIEETQLLGSKMEVHVHLKNAFQAELETEESRLATIFGLPPTPRCAPSTHHVDWKERSPIVRGCVAHGLSKGIFWISKFFLLDTDHFTDNDYVFISWNSNLVLLIEGLCTTNM